MANQLPLGAYIGDPGAGNFQQNWNAFTAAVGQAPQFLDAFTDFTNGWGGMVPSAQYGARVFAASPQAHNTTPVIAVALGTNADWAQQPAIGTFKDIANGKYDDVFRGIAQAWRDQGITGAYFRLGWEMDGNYMPWSMGNDAGSVAAWTAAFRHAAQVIKSVPGENAKIVWNPATTNTNAVPVQSAYPGDDVVDVVGFDIYSPTYKYDGSVSDQQYWSHPSASQYYPNGQPGGPGFGLADAVAFAQQHGKPIGIAETGDSNNPAFPPYLAQTLSGSGVPVSFINVWDTTQSDGDWHFSGGANPSVAAAWAQAFSGNTPAPPAAAPALSNAAPQSAVAGAVGATVGGDTITLHVSADNWNGSPQFTVSVDGVQQGGVMTTSASHADGASDAFTFANLPSQSAHDVAVTFLNDAYGGTASTDRNLYVNGIDVNGQAQGGAAAALYVNTAQHLGVPGLLASNS